MKLRQTPLEEWPTAQPHEAWAQARAHYGVVESEPPPWDPDTLVFAVVRFAEADHVLRDWQTFSSSVHVNQDRFRGVTIRQMDGAEHRRHRALVAPAFRAGLEQWEKESMRPLMDRLLDAITPAGRADLVADVTSHYPIQVIARILGVPAEDHERFLAWSEGIVQGTLNPAAGMEAAQAMADYLSPIVAARRADPQDDLLSQLVTAEEDGERLDDDHLFGFLRLLIPAGAETTFRQMGNVLLALLAQPDVLASVTAEPASIPAVIEETLRWEPSVTQSLRVATSDTEISGVAVPADAMVRVLTGSANRDETRWNDPDVWDPTRPLQPNLGFGTGPHQCVGLQLARSELRVGLEAVLERLANLRLDPDQPAPVIQGEAFRAPTTLPVLFDPSPKRT